MDDPIAPGSRGFQSYAWQLEGRDNKTRQRYRNTLFKASKEAIVEAAKTHLRPALEKACIVSFGPKELFVKEQEPLANKGFSPFEIKEV